jgi:diguanylate cyclase (GGDEF)-like protein
MTPHRAINLALAVATLLVEFATLASDDATGPYPILYFVVATSAFCFLSRVEAAVQCGLIAVAYTAGVFLTPAADRPEAIRWIAFALTLAVGGVLIAALRTRHDRLVMQLREVTRADPLTGLLDERGLDEALANELERARQSDSRFGVLVAAIDGLEELPEPQRRAALVDVTGSIKATKREIDSAARLGDEIVILATYTDERGADRLAERICTALRELTPPRTMSVGVASHPRHGVGPDVLLCAARGARQEAAGLGGDRSLVAASAADGIAARLLSPDVQVVPVE